MQMPSAYDGAFARVYDRLVGNGSHRAQWVKAAIETTIPGARSLLELGCGTGSVLDALDQGTDFALAGLDLSRDMLRSARSRLSRTVALHQMNMVHFRLAGRFDAIIAVFDTVNHLVDLDDWPRLFAAVSKHLSTGGVFLLDLLEPNWIATAAYIFRVENDVVIQEIAMDGPSLVDMRIDIFEAATNGLHYERSSVEIRERTLPRSEVIRLLGQHFKRVEDYPESQPGHFALIASGLLSGE